MVEDYDKSAGPKVHATVMGQSVIPRIEHTGFEKLDDFLVCSIYSGAFYTKNDHSLQEAC